MKKYLVVGNPINHSLSPELHNHWIKQNGLDAIYETTQPAPKIKTFFFLKSKFIF